MSLVNKLFGRGHGKGTSDGKTSEADRLAADRARQVSMPAAQSLSDQAAARASMEQELEAQRERRESAPADRLD